MPVVCKGCQEVLTLCRCAPDQREMFFRERREMAMEEAAKADKGKHTKPSSSVSACVECGRVIALCTCRRKRD